MQDPREVIMSIASFNGLLVCCGTMPGVSAKDAVRVLCWLFLALTSADIITLTADSAVASHLQASPRDPSFAVQNQLKLRLRRETHVSWN